MRFSDPDQPLDLFLSDGRRSAEPLPPNPIEEAKIGILWVKLHQSMDCASVAK